jgi:hypothetical protein
MLMPSCSLALRSVSRRRVLASLALVAGAFVAGTPASAFERRPLPSAALIRADGTPLDVVAMARDEAWLIIYVDPDAPASARLLQALVDWSLEARAVRVLLVMTEGPTTAAAVSAWQDKLGGVTLAIDQRGQARRPLGVRAVPTILGARGAWIEWQVAGVLNDPEMLRQVVLSWLADDRPPA